MWSRHTAAGKSAGLPPTLISGGEGGRAAPGAPVGAEDGAAGATAVSIARWPARSRRTPIGPVGQSVSRSVGQRSKLRAGALGDQGENAAGGRQVLGRCV